MRQCERVSSCVFVMVVLFLLEVALGAQTSGSESASLSQRAQIGKEIFNDRCYLCHDVDSSRRRPLGPPLDGLFKRPALLVGKPVNDENVKEVIKMGPTPGMPGFRYTLTDQQIADVVEYLKSR